MVFRAVKQKFVKNDFRKECLFHKMTRRTVAMAFARSQLQVVKEMMALVVEKNGNKRWKNSVIWHSHCLKRHSHKFSCKKKHCVCVHGKNLYLRGTILPRQCRTTDVQLWKPSPVYFGSAHQISRSLQDFGVYLSVIWGKL